MVKLKERKLKWALNQSDKTNKDLAFVCGIKTRRFQQLKRMYKLTGKIPKLIKKRHPKTELSKDNILLIKKAISESKLEGAVSIRLYIQKYYGIKLPYGKLHKHLLQNGISKHDKKKQKQRKYCRYERKHSGSLGHTDYHTSKVIPGKEVIIWIDDASRFILAGGEFDNATTENAIKIVLEAEKVAHEKYMMPLLELNTDRGCQFYANKIKLNNEKGIAEFEIFLKKRKIKHILSRRNHPQTNGKNERWNKTYEQNRGKFATFEEFIEWYNNRIHLGLSRTEGITPSESIVSKLRQESLIGLFFRRFD